MQVTRLLPVMETEMPVLQSLRWIPRLSEAGGRGTHPSSEAATDYAVKQHCQSVQPHSTAIRFCAGS